MLSGAAFNALLKTLEEPPPRVVFIMATTERHKVPETILSRCQQFEFRTIATARILDRLLNRLPETQREIVVLRVAVGLSAEEVGVALDMTSVAVRVAQSRALAKLRSLAADLFDEPMERRAV